MKYDQKHNYRFNLIIAQIISCESRLIVNRRLRENKKLNWNQFYGEIHDENNPERVEENNDRASNNCQP